MSLFILKVFELWVNMDKCAIIACPILRDYHPVFTPKSLDVLHLSTVSEMRRLQAVQSYLQGRCDNCRLAPQSIFSEPTSNCFAARYLNQPDDGYQLQLLTSRIEAKSSSSRNRKESEWQKACSKYDELSEKISRGSCVCSFNRDGSRNVRGCSKCYHRRCRKKIRITVHEDFLPAETAQKAAVVFELGIPRYLQEYRNVTWRIFSKLGHPSTLRESSPTQMLLKDYSQLRPYMQSTADGISLASAKKSFLQAHYKGYKMKVDLHSVVLPLGLSFCYYDQESLVWLRDFNKPVSFHHLCGVHIPLGLLGSVIDSSIHPPGAEGPTSYETVANQTKCPSDISIHEFTALQRLLAGKNRRWMTMLVELGSSNVNFSAEDTMHLFSHLAVQAGPAQYTTNVLRDVHIIFRDDLFCQRLEEQIEKRLRIIIPNWRETHCMELLLTLTLRLHALTTGVVRQSAKRLLKIARDATLHWISHLRGEVRHAANAAAAMRAAHYGFWAALLCRRTFAIFTSADDIMSAADLCSFFQASVALQENLVIDPSKLSPHLENMLMRDLKMAYHIRSVVRNSVMANPGSLGDAINKAWSGPRDSIGRNFSLWNFLPTPNDSWVVSTMTSKEKKWGSKQVVHYNILEGYLLVDGMPLGRLPLEIIESDHVKELFGNQHLLTFPSSLSGMSHTLATRMYDYEIHFGLRDDEVVIRALSSKGLLEYVPGRVFRKGSDFDLPATLIDNCTHWLNFHSGELEIRRKPSIWRTRPGDWVLNLHTRQAKRREVFLVDPHAEICQQVKGIFRDFEEPQQLTVFQPARGKLSVELKRLDLSFVVNANNLLECRQLRAEIDPDQDAGTLYGFESKLVLRDMANSERRSVITGLGKLSYERHGMHVAVRVTSTNGYGKFGIDNILGRLSCAPEPRLLYSKALFHASTSFILPDSLTACTGTEEAYRTLSSGCCQPWMPIISANESILREIELLSPIREYYPKDKRVLQTVRWNDDLTTTIQHDCYRPLIEEILLKSDRLRAFDLQKEGEKDIEEDASKHLQHRGQIRRSLYEHSLSEAPQHSYERDQIYEPKDRHASSVPAMNVYQTVKLLHRQPFTVHTSADLAYVLQNLQGKFIGGFNNMFGGPLGSLSNQIDDDIGEQWGNLVNFCRNADPDNMYKVVFRLGLLAFGMKPDMEAIRVLCAFSLLEELKHLQPPPCPVFVDFKAESRLTLEHLERLINPIDSTSQMQLWSKRRRRILAQFSEEDPQKAEGKRLASYLLDQWPSTSPSVEAFESDLLDIGVVMERVRPEWTRFYDNMQLLEYAEKIREVLSRYAGCKETSMPHPWHSSLGYSCWANRGNVVPSLSLELLLKPGLGLSEYASINDEMLHRSRVSNRTNKKSEVPGRTAPSTHMTELEDILSSFIHSPKRLWQQYGNDLWKSLDALRNVSDEGKYQISLPDLDNVSQRIQKTRTIAHNHLLRISYALSSEDDRFRWLQLGHLWPRITPITALEQLRSSANHTFGNGMKEVLVSYGVLITTLQWLLRVRHQQLRKDQQKLLEEWRDKGHENWNPLDFPDWLLLEVESNFLIRREQIDVASAIISPPSASNSVLQLNMGKGKTSCIVPMAVAVLANAKQICRLVVPKALLQQTAQTLQSRIGGLVGREVRHIPFSRRTPTTPEMLGLYAELHKDILESSGVILAVPEHILSYKLSGFQRLAESRLGEAREMVKFQSWLTRTCRDVLDESDFTLAVKTQLIYPSGQLVPVDGHPDRWVVAQTLLSLVQDHLADICKRFPRSVEVVKRPSGFPMVHILKTEIEDYLQRKLTDTICDGRTSILQLPNSLSIISRNEIKRLLSEERPDRKVFKRVSQLFPSESSTFKSILLIRGLLVNRILFLCLKKRWNVQYGLHPKRHPIAVPFEAKGVPSEQAEFGHPDVTILFTCLAFYYSGLSISQLKEGVGHVLKSDDPASEYDQWTAGCDSLPEALRHWNIINADDAGQVQELWRHLRLSRNVLNYYMNIFVFPLHAKQFGVKLQSSAWDLPLLPPNSENFCAKTTGFSGTNDNRRLLPLTIRQDDMASLSHTNAEVLTYLLQDRNRKYMVAADRTGGRLTEEQLLRKISHEGIRVIIDAGACILEMDNMSLAKAWLDIDTKAQGAVYFGTNDNRAWVQYRGGKEPVPLLATPFADNLEQCLVYLDEAHTRGVDLKLPRNACGALTLALGQTKDHTVQAAMRLRQLATNQSIVFFAPPEVHQSILDVCNKNNRQHIDSSDVVHWLLEQTCRGNEQLQSLYIAQGSEFCRRTSAALEYPHFFSDKTHKSAFLKVIQSPERLTLKELYGIAIDSQQNDPEHRLHPSLSGIVEELAKQRQNADHAHSTFRNSAMEEVEQEREVEFQVEEIREVQNPAHYEALGFSDLHPAISCFAKTGILSGSTGYEPVLSALSRTSLGRKYRLCDRGSQLFVSIEFMRTIVPGPNGPDDNFLRSVEYVLWNPATKTALVVIPEEAELLIPIIRAAKLPPVHLIAYAAPMTKNMLHFSGLSYYVLPRLSNNHTIPDWLSIELGILGARLYFEFVEYAPLVKYLNLTNDPGACNNAPLDGQSVVSNDSISSFLLEWLTVRRKGQDIMQTPMGYICQGRPLDESHPFFRTANVNVGEIWGSLKGESTSQAIGDEDSGSDHELVEI